MIKKIFDELFSQLTDMGGLFFYGVIAAYFLINQISVFLQLFYSLIIIMLIGVTVRFFYFKERPKKRKHSNFLEKIDAASFPSLHSARITALFIIIQELMNNLTTAFFGVITLIVIYSRIHLKHHKLKDVLGGILLGIISTIILL